MNENAKKQIIGAFPLMDQGNRIGTVYSVLVSNRSEVCGLKWDAVDFDSGTISVCRTAAVDNGKFRIRIPPNQPPATVYCL